jgi:uncharacterized OB-fold protein
MTASEFAPFWEHAARDRLAFPQCEDCRRFHWYPLTRCPHCGSPNLAWTTVPDRGLLYSWTLVHHAFRPSDSVRLPYVVALVDVVGAPGVRLVTNMDRDHLPLLAAGLTGRLFTDRRDPDESRIGFVPDQDSDAGGHRT